MHDRELLPLLLLEAEGKRAITGRTRMQKLVFLLQQHFEDTPGAYNYIPYDYGPFSRELYFDIDELVERGVIKETETQFGHDNVVYEYELGPRAETYLDRWSEGAKDELRKAASEIKSGYNQWNLRKLLEFVYEEYPEYASRSVL